MVQTGAASSSSASARVASLILRIVTFLLLFISLVVLATSKVGSVEDETRIRFQDFYGLRYMIATIVIGTAYSLLQLAFSIYNLVCGSDGMLLLNFFGDKFISYLLATGAAAGFGVTLDFKRWYDQAELYKGNFYDKAFASESLLLLAFFCTAILSIISAYTLPKRL